MNSHFHDIYKATYQYSMQLRWSMSSDHQLTGRERFERALIARPWEWLRRTCPSMIHSCPSTVLRHSGLCSTSTLASFNLPSFKRQVYHHLRDQMAWFFFITHFRYFTIVLFFTLHFFSFSQGMQTRERAHCARSVFPFVKKKERKKKKKSLHKMGEVWGGHCDKWVYGKFHHKNLKKKISFVIRKIWTHSYIVDSLTQDRMMKPLWVHPLFQGERRLLSVYSTVELWLKMPKLRKKFKKIGSIKLMCLSGSQ